MLLDCGDHAAINRGKLAVPVLPNGKRHAGEWIAHYVERVNPSGRDVDYLVVSHFHSDHTGCEGWHAGKTSGRDNDYFLSWFAQAAETLRFRTAIDRDWPNYDDPIPLAKESDEGSLGNMLKLYGHLRKRDGLTVENFVWERMISFDRGRIRLFAEDFPFVTSAATDASSLPTVRWKISMRAVLRMARRQRR